MKKDFTTVLDFGTQKITVAVGLKCQNGLVILGSSEVEYGGFLNGEFLQVDKLGETVQKAINLAQSNTNTTITNMVVGVPSVFTSIVCKTITKNYEKKIKITKQVLDKLYESGDDFNKYPTHKMFSSNPIEFKLDDGSVCLNCIGSTTTKLTAKVSYVLFECKFIKLINEIANILGIRIDSFISSNIAEYQSFIKPSLERNVIIDCGHLTTSVTICKGNGIESLYEFAYGGGFITSDLLQYLKLDYNVADLVKRKVVLSIVPSEQDFYNIKYNGENISVLAYTVNEVVVNAIEKIAKTIAQCLEMNYNLIDAKTNFYLCGGGVYYIRGAKDIISRLIGHELKMLIPTVPQLSKPQYTSVVGLLDKAIVKNKKKKFIFF